jgi:two-component system, sensor histidine kinase and response regulator
LTTFNFPDLVNEIIKDISNKNGIEKSVRFRLSGDIRDEIKSDQLLLRIVLYNLLENSFKYYDRREAEPYVELNIDLGDQLTLNVIDNGIGIDAILSNRIFDFFFVASEKRGAGLGLYQARQAAIKLGGTIHLKSFKKPTSFVVILPLA